MMKIQDIRTERSLKRCTPALLGVLVILALAGGTPAFGEATLTSDKPDYFPGEIAILTGTGFGDEEWVWIDIDILDPDTWEVIWWDYDWQGGPTDEYGWFQVEYLIPVEAAGLLLRARATGETSGLEAETTFMDTGCLYDENCPGSLSELDDFIAACTEPCGTVGTERFTCNNDFKIILDSVSSDGMTFTYKIYKTGELADLSHIVFAYDCVGATVTGAGPGDVSLVGPDPSTGLYGIKFDMPDEGPAYPVTVSLTVVPPEGYVVIEGCIVAGTKAGNQFIDPPPDPEAGECNPGYACIPGPVCVEGTCDCAPPQEATVECDESLDPYENSALGIATCVDMGCAAAGGTCQETYTDGDPMPGDCEQEYSFTRTWRCTCTATGLYTECDQIIYVEDNTAPTFTCPADVDLGCNPTELPTCATVTALVTDLDDDCDEMPTLDCEAGLVEENGCYRSQTFTLTATDDCGNTSDPCYVTYTWSEDETAPVLSGVPDGGDLGCIAFEDRPACDSGVTA
ncbi:MAG: hypothetical protein JSV78_05470, partial [Phycisphaerales bacterium]